ncbi:MAG: TonB-dependent receptor plug domain-containing protein, partial [Bacteroidota bacterium]
MALLSHIPFPLLRLPYICLSTLLLLAQTILATPDSVISHSNLKSVYLTISWENISLEDALLDIEQKTEFYFAYDKNVVERYQVSQHAKRISLEKLLRKISRKTDLKFTRVSKTIFVNRKLSSKLGAVESLRTFQPFSLEESPSEQSVQSIDLDLVPENNQVVIGQVLGSEGIPLMGAKVWVEGTQIGVHTDKTGHFHFSLPGGKQVLLITFMGYMPYSVALPREDQIEVYLQEHISTLEEIVVLGYGSEKREEVTGAIHSLSMEKVGGQALTSIDQAIQGRAAGVMVTNVGGGAPGGGFQVTIRGVGTINSETPLYVIDGIPIQEKGNGQLGTSFLASLNPNDIESIHILKDASAAAIYGARASGGVILITTKRGRTGPVKVDFEGYYGLQLQQNHYPVLQTEQYTDFLQELHQGPDGQLPPAYEGATSTVNTDWQAALFQTAPIQNYHLGLSGGNRTATFGLGVEYFDQEGTMLGSGFDRYALRANSDIKLSKRIKLSETLLFSRTTRTRNDQIGGRRSLEHAIKQAPTVPVEDPTFL